jgi:hypothetical protein
MEVADLIALTAGAERAGIASDGDGGGGVGLDVKEAGLRGAGIDQPADQRAGDEGGRRVGQRRLIGGGRESGVGCPGAARPSCKLWATVAGLLLEEPSYTPMPERPLTMLLARRPL